MPQSRSSFAIAMEDYKAAGGLRPGIALTLAAVALIAAIAVGAVHIIDLGKSRESIDERGRTIRAIHSYNAALEVWRKMAVTPTQFPEQTRLRDSISTTLTAQLSALEEQVQDSVDKRLVAQVLEDLRQPSDAEVWGPELGIRGRAAMIVLTARQDSALVRIAAGQGRSQFFAAVFIGLSLLAAGILVVPMSWVYVRFKRGHPMGT
jgi:hypothetical protein